ncbi:MAG: NAD(P)/FAD-dependent oxidoreductase [Desulfuromonadaceae bacterium]|nr:NAD(P)/FAD-dependent oxidoreductase [Desulfuromonadaceae bacterium]
MRYDYAVIGGGISGMTAALLLAKHGRRTVLIEQAPRLAPLVGGFQRDGVNFDTGFHYAGGLAPGESLHLFLRYLGLLDPLQIKAFDPAGFDRFQFADGMSFALPLGDDAIIARLARLFPTERVAIATYLQRLAAAAGTFPYINLDRDFTAQPTLDYVHGPSLQEVLDELFIAPRLKEIFAAHCVLHGAPPSDIPFALHACFVGPYYRSAHGFVGGGAALVAAFETALRAAGVEILTGRAVERILGDSTGVCGVRLVDGEEVTVAAVIATVHPARLIDLVADKFFRPIFKKRMKQLENTTSALIFYVACETAPEWLLRSNVLMFDAAPGGMGTGPDDGLLFIAGAERSADPSRCGGMVVISPCAAQLTARWQESRFGGRPADYRHFKDELSQKLLRRLQLFPECGAIRSVAVATPLTLRDYSNNPGGGLYGVKHRVGQYNPQPLTRVPNLLLAGQAVAGPGLFGTMLSAFLCCGTVLGHEQLREELKQCR